MSKPKMSAPAAAIEILKAEGDPLHVKKLTELVMTKYDTGLKGKTPVATLSAKLHTSAKKGETFVKTAPGTFGLLPESSETATKARPNRAKRASRRKVPAAV